MEEASWGQSTDGFQPSHSGGIPSHSHADPANIPAVGDLLPAHVDSTRYRKKNRVIRMELPMASYWLFHRVNSACDSDIDAANVSII